MKNIFVSNSLNKLALINATSMHLHAKLLNEKDEHNYNGHLFLCLIFKIT